MLDIFSIIMTKEKSKTDKCTLEGIRCVIAAIEDKKGEAIRVLDVRGKSSITDYIVLATGTSDPHVKALKSELDQALKEADIQLIGQERTLGSGWLVVDAFDFTSLILLTVFVSEKHLLKIHL